MERRRIFRDTIILLLAVTMVWSLLAVNCVKSDPGHDIVIYVDESIKDLIQDDLDIFIADLQDEDWSPLVLVCNVTEATPEGIRSNLGNCWVFYDIKGCLLIGDFPSAEWVNGTSCYTDYYYMDLNGSWTDADDPPEGKRFNNHTGHIRPEIWVGRLMASTIVHWHWGYPLNETELINDYFEKNHQYRNASSRAELTRPRALAYIDNPMAYGGSILNESGYGYNPVFVNDTVSCLEKAYADVTLVADPIPNGTNTNANDYKDRLKNTDGYEWTWVFDHGCFDSHGFEKYFWNETHEPPIWQRPGGPNEGGVGDSYYQPETPQTFFYLFSSCSAAKFSLDNCVANCAIFGEGSALVSIGMTEDGAFFASWFSEAFNQLGQHRCIGEALKAFYNSTIDYYSGTKAYKKMILLGDPTIKINSPPQVPSQPLGQQSGYQEVIYEYTTNTTDLNGDQISYQFDWDDGTNTTVGPYDSCETGEASHAWSCPGTYSVKVRAKDVYDVWSDWSQPLNVTIDERIRYMQNAKWDSTYWKLFWNNTITSTHKTVCKFGYCLYGELGVKIYKGTTCISGASVIKVGRWYNLQSRLKSTTWDCDEHNVTGTYIKIQVYYKFAGSSWQNMGVAFKTETFTENTILNATEWTIYLYGEFQMEWGPLRIAGPPEDKASITFCWGSSSEESRIEDMTFTYG